MGEETGGALTLYCHGAAVKGGDDGSDTTEARDVNAKGDGEKLKWLDRT